MKNLKIQKMVLALMMVFMVTSVFGATKTRAQQTKLITVKSTKSFNATVEGIKKGVANAGMMVLAEIDQDKILSMTGLTINAKSLFIGNPTVGKTAFSDNPAVGLAIPIRINVYEKHGVTYINYFEPSSQLGFFKGEKVKMIGQKMDKKVAMLTGMFSK